MFKHVLTVAAFTWLVASVRADVIVFSDAFNTNGPLLGTTPQVGGLWTITGTSVVNPLQVVSGQASLVTTGQDAYSAFSAPVPVATTQALQTSFTLTVSAAQATGDYFLHLSDPAGTASNFYSRIFARSSGGGFLLGFASNAGTGTVTTYGSDVLTFGTSYQVSSTWNFISGPLNDTFSLSVNGNPYIASYTWTGAAEPATNVSAVNFRQGTGANAATLLVDNLQVKAIPEPSSASIVGLALVGLVGLRRRRV
jgi:hypothetical protein